MLTIQLQASAGESFTNAGATICVLLTLKLSCEEVDG